MKNITNNFNYLSVFLASRWIGNLGVVPTWLFLFFLFLPNFFNLRRLLTFVCIVLEAIVCSLLFNINNLKQKLIINSKVFVKRFALLVTMLLTQYTYGSTQTLYISRGEQKALKIGTISRFSVGNKEIIKTKHDPQSQKILIKGTALGFTDLLVWEQSTNKMKKFHIFVLSKKEQMMSAEIEQALQKIGLSTQVNGDHILITGKIRRFSHYKIYHSIKWSHLNPIHQVKLSKALRLEILTKLNQRINEQRISASCQFRRLIEVHCETRHPKKLKDMKLDIPLHIHHYQKGYKLKLFMISLENSLNNQRQLGTENINQELSEVLENNILTQSNQVTLSDSTTKARIQTKLEGIVYLGTPFSFTKGLETSVLQVGPQTQRTDWRFSGVKIKGIWQETLDQHELHYELEMTEGAERKGQVIQNVMKENMAFSFNELLSWNTQTQKVEDKELPWIAKVPLIGILFSSQTKVKQMSTYKLFLKLEVLK